MKLSISTAELELVDSHAVVEAFLEFAEIALKIRLVVRAALDLRHLEAVVLLLCDRHIDFERGLVDLVTEARKILPGLGEGRCGFVIRVGSRGKHTTCLQ